MNDRWFGLGDRKRSVAETKVVRRAIVFLALTP
jgi:hypothetical protein